MSGSESSPSSPLSDRLSGRVESEISSSLAKQQVSSVSGADCWQSLPAPRLGRRGLEQLQARLSERDLEIVRSVARCRLVSGDQLQRWWFPEEEHASLDAARRATRRCLARLTSLHLLFRLHRAVGGIRAGSSGFVYQVGGVGLRLLALEAGENLRGVSKREPSASFMSHALAVSEFALQLLIRARRENAGFTLSSLQIEAEAWRRFVGIGGGSTVLAPDLFVHVLTPEHELAWFVEVDLGTEHRGSLTRKAERYLQHYRTGKEQASLGFYPRVLWVVPNEGRATYCREVFASVTGLPKGMMVVGVGEAAVERISDEAVGEPH